MEVIRLVRVCAISACLAAVPAMASAQAADAQALRQEIDQLKADLEMLRQQYSDRLSALEARLATLKEGAPPAPDSSIAPTAQAAAAAAVGSSKVFNPDISVIGNFVGVAGRNELSELPSMSLTEVEAAFQAIVDPYAGANFFLSASPDGVEVEEGYITFTALPSKLLLRVGKMRAQFGKVNPMHTHILPWENRPLVFRNLFGGEEGVVDAGFSVSKLIPNGFMFIDAIGEVYQSSSEVFQSEARSELTYMARLRGYRDLTEGINIDLGASYAHGPTAVIAGFNTQRIGFDATLRYRPLRRAIYRQFVGRTEFIWGTPDVSGASLRNPWGFYSSADYQFARRWFIGIRVDRSGRAVDGALVDSGGSIYLTFRPSEFSLIRGQLQRTRYAEGINSNEALLQFNFAIGAHGAHPF